ncbi:MAG: tRNA-intron lyase [Acidobacteriota bacterium]
MGAPTGKLEDGTVTVGGDARQRFHDARGYGRPAGGRGDAVELTPVEAAHLLGRGDLSAVDGMGFREFVTRCADGRFVRRYLVYGDLRERGYYLSPTRWVEPSPEPSERADFVVYERGTGPAADRRRYVVRAVGERTSLPAGSLADGVLAIVDEEGEVTYLGVGEPALSGDSARDLPGDVPGTLLADRVVLWAAPAGLYRRTFFGHPFGAGTGSGDAGEPSDERSTVPLGLSLVEAAYLADRGAIRLDPPRSSLRGDQPGTGATSAGTTPGGAGAGDAGGGTGPGLATVVARGRELEGDRFDRRVATYTALRERGLVPKTGFKFGADFRTYTTVTSVEDLPHAEHLVRVVPPDHTFLPRELSLDVRLAHGVRKRMVFAIPSPNDRTDIAWRSVRRLTP